MNSALMQELNDFKVSDSGKISKEIIYRPINIFVIMFINLFLAFYSIGSIITSDFSKFPFLEILILIIAIVIAIGYNILEPNTSLVLVLFGKYIGTMKEEGFFWVNPFFKTYQLSLRSNNLNGHLIKVNDKSGNPIQISCVVVWRVKDTAKALFDVINYNNYVQVQSEAALRHLACMFSYEKVKEDDISLRSGHEMITKVLHDELSSRLFKAGIEVEEAMISELSYSPEIANAMLKSQAAEAVINAREKIVKGAVSIVGHAVQALSQNNIVNLQEEEKSKLVSNMLVVLCSESQVHPVVQAGTA